MQPGGADTGRGPARRWLGRLGRWVQPEENPAGVVYGTITTGALLAAESTRQENLVEAVGAAVLTLVLYWAAHSYSQMLGDRLDSGEPWSAGRFLEVAVHEAALLKGAVLPVVVLVVVAAAGFGTPDAVVAALVAAGALVVSLELVAGRRAQLRREELAVQVAITAGIGAGVVALKLVVH
jgi:hypothetical protein